MICAALKLEKLVRCALMIAAVWKKVLEYKENNKQKSRKKSNNNIMKYYYELISFKYHARILSAVEMAIVIEENAFVILLMLGLLVH